jgi:hypothetical protein
MDATFTLALLGVVLSMASLTWQFVNFVLTGPRVAVELQLGVTNEDDSSTMAWSLPSRGSMQVDARTRDPTREVAIVIARNRGRAAISIASVGLVAGQTGLLKYDASTAGISDDIVRLEPGHTHQWRADVWPVVDELRSTWPEGSTLNVRAVAELGNGRFVYSPRWAAWAVAPSLTSVLPGAPAGHAPPDRAGKTRVISAARRTRRWLGWLRR